MTPLDGLQSNYLETIKGIETIAQRTGSTNVKSADEALYALFKGLSDLGTTGGCKACAIEDLSQMLSVQAEQDCAFTLNLQNDLDQQLTSALVQSASIHKDILSSLAQVLGASTKEQVITEIANRMNALITTNVTQRAINFLQGNQNILIYSNGSAVAKQHVHQNAALDSVTSFLSSTKIMNSVLEKEEWTKLQDASIDQSTITKLGDVTAQGLGLLTKMVTSEAGKAVVFVWGITLVIFVFVVIFFIVKTIQKSWNNAEQRKMRKELNSSSPSESNVF